MAKKRAAAAKRRATTTKAFTLNVTNLKFINAAFDTAIKDLKTIRTNAVNKTEVAKTIGELEDLQAKVAKVCPQNWYAPFAVK